MKVYVSAHGFWEAKYVADVLRSKGFKVVSEWHLDKPLLNMSDETKRAKATVNVSLISSADALVIVACNEFVPGSKFVEAGVALGLGKKVVVIGHRENMLMHHPAVHDVESPLEAAAYLRPE
jgi:nucleoside 2-deoxyribosyltransferase